jgi:hypothetical protein
LKLKEHGAKRAPVVIFKCSIHIHNYYLKKWLKFCFSWHTVLNWSCRHTSTTSDFPPEWICLRTMLIAYWEQ